MLLTQKNSHQKKKTKHKKQKKSEKIKLADAWKRNGEMKQWATTEKENERIRERKWKKREREAWHSRSPRIIRFCPRSRVGGFGGWLMGQIWRDISGSKFSNF